VRFSGLTAPTVSSAVEYLEGKGLINGLGIGASSGGRPPDMFCFNAEFGYIAGVDLGGTNIRIALADLNGKVISR
jgi:glucokinase